LTQPTVLVTGAAGVLGERLARMLMERGWKVRGLVHRRPVRYSDERIQASLEDAEALGGAVRGADAVVHLAAITHARRAGAYFRTNVDGTRNLLSAAAGVGVARFVYVSTRAIDTSGGAYSASKAEAEALVSNAGIDFVIVRLPEIYGTSGNEGLERIVEQARSGSWIPIVAGDQQVCPLHVDDAVAACAGALEATGLLMRTVTLGGECLTLREFAAVAAAAFGGRSRIVEIPTVAVRAASLAARVAPLPLVPDQLKRLQAPKPLPTAEAPALLGFTPTPLADGLARVGGRFASGSRSAPTRA
jgi:2-alkyl-3-oxoalkanoate reductase